MDTQTTTSRHLRAGLLPRRWRCNSAARVCRRDLTPCSIPFLSASGAPRRYLLRQQTTALLFSFCRYSVRRIPSLLLISFVFIFFLPKKAAEGTGGFSYSVCASEMVCSEGGRHVPISAMYRVRPFAFSRDLRQVERALRFAQSGARDSILTCEHLRDRRNGAGQAACASAWSSRRLFRLM